MAEFGERCGIWEIATAVSTKAARGVSADGIVGIFTNLVPYVYYEY